jgi:hypothetical protein
MRTNGGREAMARSRRKKTTKDRLIEAALYAAPAPVRTIASNPTGFRFLLIGGAILMATGILTLDWREGMPQFKFHRDKASQVKQDLVNDLGNKVQGWNGTSAPGNGNPPGVFTQAPYNPYQQPSQQTSPSQYGTSFPANQPGWGQSPGQGNGYYNPNVPQQSQYPPAYGGSNQQWQYQQWPNQQAPYPPPGNSYPNGYGR